MTYLPDPWAYDWSLYAIIDAELLGERSPAMLCERMIAGGAGIVQYRDKISDARRFYETARQIQRVCAAFRIPFIVNDRVDIAMALDADGIHLGQSDLPAEAARRIVPPYMLIGVSASTILEFEAIQTADYYGVGALFPTGTKEDAESMERGLAATIKDRCRLPVVGIGGVQLSNCSRAVWAGCDGVAVISGLMLSENVQETAHRFVETVRSARLERGQDS